MARSSKTPRRHPFILALITKKNVMSAVILRDMRTRFFNHGLGFIMVPLWPLVHMGILIAIHGGVSHGAPAYGESTALFVATGLVPTLTFMYMSRYMGWSLSQNRQMLAFPVVTPLDVMWGRAFLELISSCITLTAIFFILWFTGQNPFPTDIETAAEAYFAVVCLAFGMGTLVGVVSMFQPFFLTIYQLMVLCIYISSGTMFVTSNLPDQYSYWLSFNPVTECVEWMRTAFYESYSDKLVSPTYILSFAAAALLIGLVTERSCRRILRDG